MENNIQNFHMMLEALVELRSETQKALTGPLPLAPALADILEEIAPLPREALLLGLASDGLPVLLNLNDPRPGPILIAAEPGTGKTALLQFIAQAGAIIHSINTLQFGVITNYPEEWQHFADYPQNMGIHPTYHNKAIDFLHTISGWAHSKKGVQKSILLLIDDLESMEHLNFEDRQVLRWLLFRGPSRRVWPVVTMNIDRLEQVRTWLEAFRTRIYGLIRDDQKASSLSGISETPFSQLQAGVQFALREDEEWLKFWTPEI